MTDETETPRGDPWLGVDVGRFARVWPDLPRDVREALVTLRAFEEEGAYQPSVLADSVRGFFRQAGGSHEVAEIAAREGEPDD